MLNLINYYSHISIIAFVGYFDMTIVINDLAIDDECVCPDEPDEPFTPELALRTFFLVNILIFHKLLSETMSAFLSSDSLFRGAASPSEEVELLMWLFFQLSDRVALVKYLKDVSIFSTLPNESADPFLEQIPFLM